MCVRISFSLLRVPEACEARKPVKSVQFHCEQFFHWIFFSQLNHLCCCYLFDSIRFSLCCFRAISFLFYFFVSLFDLFRKIQTTKNYAFCAISPEEIMEAHWPAEVANICIYYCKWKWWNNCLASRVVWFSMSPPTTTALQRTHIVQSKYMPYIWK